MAQTVAATSTVVAAGGTPAPGLVNGHVRCFVEVVTYASQAAADTIVVGTLPKGAKFLYGVLTASVSSGSTTIAIGVSGTAAKYKAAAAFTATDTPTMFGVATTSHVALSAAETILITLAAATAPASGTLTVALFYTLD
jgi:hypothetical protein